MLCSPWPADLADVARGKLTKQQRHHTVRHVGGGGAGRASRERIRKANNPQMMYAI